MHIVLFCATRRGVRFLERLISLAKGCELSVFSFREEPWEPRYLDEIRALARANGVQLFEAKHVSVDCPQSFWSERSVDLILAVSWRYLVPSEVYRRASKGAFVFHDSLLPKYRGFAPTVWAMINGEPRTGVTLFEMNEKVDAGDIVEQVEVPIGPGETIRDVTERVTQCYLQVLEENLPRLLDGTANRNPQDESQASYTCRLLPEDCVIDWKRTCREIYNLVRAYAYPYPGAYTYLDGKKLLVWGAELPEAPSVYVGSVPGRIVSVLPGKGVEVLARDGALLLTQVQLVGAESPASADQLINSLSTTLGSTARRMEFEGGAGQR